MNQTDLLTSQKMQLYNTLIEPVLNYGSEIWGYHKAPEVESIQNFAENYSVWSDLLT